jgi:hypothetical protein
MVVFANAAIGGARAAMNLRVVDSVECGAMWWRVSERYFQSG